jgi:chromosome segregation ATPase
VETHRAEQDLESVREQLAAVTQERAVVLASLQEEQTHRESQTKQFMQRIAEVQLRESALKEQIETQNKEWDALAQEWQAKLSAQEQDIAAQQAAFAEEMQKLSAQEQETASHKEAFARAAAQLEAIRDEKNELEIYRTQTMKETDAMRREIKAMAQAQIEWKATVVDLQNERSQREQEWSDKEKTWESAKLEWEKTIMELEQAKAAAQTAAEAAEHAAKSAAAQAASQPAPVSAAAPAASPEASNAIAAIRQQMQEMQTLLAWLRPVKKQPLSKAA